MRAMHSMMVMKLLADGHPRTTKQVADALGLTERQAFSALAHSREHRRVSSSPVTYSITPLGIERAKFVPMTKEQRQEKQRQDRRDKKAALALVNADWAANVEKRRLAALQPKDKALTHMDAKTLVRSAMKSRTALDMAWMSVAREQEATHV